MDWNAISGIVGTIIYILLAILGIIQLAQIVIPVLGFDNNKFYIKFVKGMRSITLWRKNFSLNIKKSYKISQENVDNVFIKKILNHSLAEFKLKFFDNESEQKLSAVMKRFGFEIQVTVYIHEEFEDENWVLIEQKMDVKFNKIKDALITAFNNIQRLNNENFYPMSDKADIMVHAQELMLFKALFKEMGTNIIGNISLVQKDEDTYLKIRDIPEIELAQKISNFIKLGYV